MKYVVKFWRIFEPIYFYFQGPTVGAAFSIHYFHNRKENHQKRLTSFCSPVTAQTIRDINSAIPRADMTEAALPRAIPFAVMKSTAKSNGMTKSE